MIPSNANLKYHCSNFAALLPVAIYARFDGFILLEKGAGYGSYTLHLSISIT